MKVCQKNIHIDLDLLKLRCYTSYRQIERGMINMSQVQHILDSWVSRARSSSAREKYSSHNKEFFDIMFNKNLSDVTASDLQELLPVNIDTKYKNVLKQRGQKDSTIKQKLKSVSQFMNKLSINRVFEGDGVDYNFIIKESLSTNDLKDDSGKYSDMTHEDMQELKDWLFEERYTSERYGWKAKYYSVLVDLLYVTGARLSATFKIKWSDIKYRKDKYNQYTHVIYVTDKGDKLNKYPITKEFYQYLLENLDSENDTYLFERISQRGITNDMKQFCVEQGLEDEAFSPHSLRRLGITTYYSRNKDIVKTARFASHESIETTMNYISEDNNSFESGSYILSGKTLERSDIEELTKEQLLEILSDRDEIMYTIYNEAKNRGYLVE